MTFSARVFLRKKNNFTNTNRTNEVYIIYTILYDIANWKVRDQVNHLAEDIIKQIIPIQIKITQEIDK
jgi:hypothetical protein